MAKKKVDNKKIIAIILIIIIGFTAYYCTTRKSKIVDNQGVKLKVFVSDGRGNKLQELTQAPSTMSTVTMPGGGSQTNVNYIVIESTITNPPEQASVPVTVLNIMGQNDQGDTSIYNTALNTYQKQFDLSPGDINSQTSDDIDVTQLEYGNVLFRMDVNYQYIGPQGTPVSQSTYGTIMISIAGDECSGGIPVNGCNGNGMRCASSGGGLGLIWDTYNCPCDSAHGWVAQNGQCVLMQCSNGVMAGQCFTPSYSDTRNYCEAIPGGGAMETEKCTGTDQTLGTGDDCSCPTDYYGNPSSCQYDGKCQFQMYSGNIQISLGDSGAPAPTGGCTSANECSDLEPCTTDNCNAGVCEHIYIDCGPGMHCEPMPGVTPPIGTCMP